MSSPGAETSLLEATITALAPQLAMAVLKAT